MTTEAPIGGGPDRLPRTTKLVYGIGSISEGTKNTAFNVFLLFYYNQVLGLSGTLSGAAIFIALCVDAITDPLTGSISDNWHSRWGRRHPFMYAGAVPMAVCFFLLFNPPALGETGLFVWLTAFAVGVRAAMTLYSIPSNAMVPELTPIYDERTSLVSYRFLFGWIGGLGGSLMGYLYFFAPSEAFANGQLNPAAYPVFGAASAAIIVTAILVCTGGTHHLIPQLKPPPEKTPFTLRRFWGELRDTFSNRSYRMLVIAALFSSAAGGFNDVVGLYVNTYFWGFTTAQMGGIVFALFISVIVAVTLTRPLTERYDKRTAAFGLAAFAVFFGPAPVFLRLANLMPDNGSPLLLPLIIGHAVIVVTAVVAIGIAVASMIGDVVDENEIKTGLRQEGMFGAAIAFTAKAASGLGTFFAGIGLDLIAFPKQADPTLVPPEKVFQLGLVVGPGLMIFYVVTLVFLSQYRITREGHRETLAELERRAEARRDQGLG